MKQHSKKPVAERHLSGVYKALEVNKLGTDHFIQHDNGKSVRFGPLPTALLAIDSQKTEEVAVLPWRWDVDPHSSSSRNVYVACQEARNQGLRYLLLDKITVN